MSVKSKLQLRIEELELFLSQLEEARKFGDEELGGSMLSPIAGMLERNELASLKKIWENCEHD